MSPEFKNIRLNHSDKGAQSKDDLFSQVHYATHCSMFSQPQLQQRNILPNKQPFKF